MRILVIDDNSHSLQSLCLVLKDLGHDPKGMEDPVAALAVAGKEFFPLVITDIRMPGLGGLDLLARLKENPFTARCDVVLITGHGDVATAVEALRLGAYDYLNKPINARELASVVDRSAEHQSLVAENAILKNTMEEQVVKATENIKQDLEKARKALKKVEGIGLVIAESASMKRLLDEALIMHSEPSVPVLIEGETGTGKEVLARYIHYGDSLVDTPFLAINCAAIPHELFESELFGHSPGAFTGSRADGSSGKLEQAGRGTLFLDEVAEMPLSLQPKLLRVLEERTFYRVGGMKKRNFTARIVCAGNRNMAEMVEKGTFRRDLYHRLRVGHLLIPPLRERPEDIRVLATHFLKRESKKKKKRFTGIDKTTMDIFLGYPWPGNVREMENTIERAVLMHDDSILLPRHVNFLFQSVATIFTQPQDMPAAGDDTLAVTALATPMAPLSSPSALSEDALYGVGSSEGTGGLGAGAPEHIWSTAVKTEGGVLDLSRMDAITLPDKPFRLEDMIDAVVATAMQRFGGNKTKTAEYLGISRFALHRRLQGKSGESNE